MWRAGVVFLLSVCCVCRPGGWCSARGHRLHGHLQTDHLHRARGGGWRLFTHEERVSSRHPRLPQLRRDWRGHQLLPGSHRQSPAGRLWSAPRQGRSPGWVQRQKYLHIEDRKDRTCDVIYRCYSMCLHLRCASQFSTNVHTDSVQLVFSTVSCSCFVPSGNYTTCELMAIVKRIFVLLCRLVLISLAAPKILLGNQNKH